MKATRRRMFGLAAAVPAAVALPAIAAPIVEMHEADVTPLITIRRPIREQLYSYVRTASVESVALEPKASFTFKVDDTFTIEGNPITWKVRSVLNG